MYDPERYENNKLHAARDAELFVPMLVNDMEWSQCEIILDYGCGAGSTGNKFILPQVEKFDSKIYSVDMSKDMIEHAKKAYPNPRVSFAVGDVLQDNFPLKDIQLDKIFAVYVLHFIRNCREAVKRFYTLLKPRGYFAFTVVSKGTMFILLEKMANSEKWSQYMKGYEQYIPEWFERKIDAEVAFQKHLTELGFEIVQLQTYHQEYFFESFNTATELYLSLNPFLKEIPLELHDELKNDYKDFLYNHWNIPKGTVDTSKIKYKYEMLYGIVRKP